MKLSIPSNLADVPGIRGLQVEELLSSYSKFRSVYEKLNGSTEASAFSWKEAGFQPISERMAELFYYFLEGKSASLQETVAALLSSKF